MKTPNKNKKSVQQQTDKHHLKTDKPLAEKDEVKQAEAKQRKK